ncbi:MAG TPA: serine hydrolase [Thermoanaerobaculia bacterium]|nr:serine hydrolase [Thermoanaerobaculia bacterium]
MRLLLSLLTTVIILIPAPWAAAAPAAQRDAAERIAEILEAQRGEQHIPGFAFALVRKDRLELVIVRGVRDVEHALPVTPDTVFPIGSCTKAFTSMAIGIAQDQHLLSLDDHPRRFLPWFHMADPQADAEVTLRDMLSHRTGLKAKADLAATPGVLNREEYVRAATAAKPAAPFRTAFQYSNAMYSAAGEVLGSAYRSSWENVIQQQIFAPLGMTASLPSVRDAATVADHATGYVYVPQTGGWRAVPPPASLQALAPAGSIASTARDMAQWLRLLTAGGRIGDRQIVSAATLQELFAPQIAIDAKMSYALGWATYTWGGEQVVEHNGGSEGISALVSFIPSERVGFVFLANTSPNFLTTIGNAGSLLWPLILGREAPAAAPADERLPSVQSLLSRMIEAVGGEDVLRRHKTLEIHAHKTYENHGVRAALTVRAKAPASRVEEEVWTAAGREIGRLRIYFDGRHGGQETTFGQDAVNDDAANDRARRDADLHPLLHLTDLYQEVRVESKGMVGAESAFLLTLVPKAGPKVLLSVSTSTGLILKRETEGESVVFSDYRLVDGERIPFRSTISDALGETTVEVEQARFGVTIEDTAFAPAKSVQGSQDEVFSYRELRGTPHSRGGAAVP